MFLIIYAIYFINHIYKKYVTNSTIKKNICFVIFFIY